MITYIQVFVLSPIICAGSLSAQATISLSDTVGSSAILPCDWRHINSTQLTSQTLHIEWRTFAETVFERMGGDQYQGEGYEGRVDVPEDKLLRGDCSLKLNDIKLTDEGVYESYMLVQQTKRSMRSKRVFLQSVEFSVHDAPKEINSENEPQAQMVQKLSQDSSSNAGVIQTSSQITVFILLTSILFRIL